MFCVNTDFYICRFSLIGNVPLFYTKVVPYGTCIDVKLVWAYSNEILEITGTPEYPKFTPVNFPPTSYLTSIADKKVPYACFVKGEIHPVDGSWIKVEV